MNARMTCPLLLALFLQSGALLPAQVVPATPKKFTTRSLSESSSTGISSAPKPPEITTRMVTYFALSEPRQWKSADGKSLLGKLIAFEDLVVEAKGASAAASKAAAAAAPPPEPPAKPTVIKDGRVRLLVNSKPYEVALDRLSADDRKFAEDVKAAVDAKPGK